MFIQIIIIIISFMISSIFFCVNIIQTHMPFFSNYCLTYSIYTFTKIIQLITFFIKVFAQFGVYHIQICSFLQFILTFNLLEKCIISASLHARTHLYVYMYMYIYIYTSLFSYFLTSLWAYIHRYTWASLCGAQFLFFKKTEKINNQLKQLYQQILIYTISNCVSCNGIFVCFMIFINFNDQKERITAFKKNKLIILFRGNI